jgi:hypothetical protein
MSKLLELAERCEKAEGPDRELDCLIWCAVNGIAPKWTGVRGELLDADREGIIGWVDPGKHSRNFSTNRSTTGPGSIPSYTASLDAAMMLVPKGWHDSIYGLGVMAADLCCVHLEPPEYDGPGERSEAATRPLALCAAALKARATQEQPE